MSAIEEMILFSAAVVGAFMLVSTLYAVTIEWSEKGESASQRLASRSFREICIQSVYSDGSDTNIYLSAVLGAFDVNDAVVYVDGVRVNTISKGLIRDRGRRGVFDGSPASKDLAYLSIPGNIFDGGVHKVTVCIDGVCSRVWGKDFKELSNCQ